MSDSLIMGQSWASSTDLSVISKSDGGTNDFSIIIGNIDATVRWEMSIDQFQKGASAIYFSQRNEELLLQTVRNFIRKTNFSELNELLEDDEMSLEEFNAELEKDSDKYAITLKKLENAADINNIVYLTEKIGNNLRKFSTSEVAEMFSVKETELISAIRPELLQK